MYKNLFYIFHNMNYKIHLYVYHIYNIFHHNLLYNESYHDLICTKDIYLIYMKNNNKILYYMKYFYYSFYIRHILFLSHLFFVFLQIDLIIYFPFYAHFCNHINLSYNLLYPFLYFLYMSDILYF